MDSNDAAYSPDILKMNVVTLRDELEFNEVIDSLSLISLYEPYGNGAVRVPALDWGAPVFFNGDATQTTDYRTQKLSPKLGKFYFEGYIPGKEPHG